MPSRKLVEVTDDVVFAGALTVGCHLDYKVTEIHETAHHKRQEHYYFLHNPRTIYVQATGYTHDPYIQTGAWRAIYNEHCATVQSVVYWEKLTILSLFPGYNINKIPTLTNSIIGLRVSSLRKHSSCRKGGFASTLSSSLLL